MPRFGEYVTPRAFAFFIFCWSIGFARDNDAGSGRDSNNSPYNYPSYYYHFVPRDRQISGPLTHQPAGGRDTANPLALDRVAFTPQLGRVDGFRRIRFCAVGHREYQQCLAMQTDLNPLSYEKPRSIIDVRKNDNNLWPKVYSSYDDDVQSLPRRSQLDKNKPKKSKILSDTVIECVQAVDKLECMNFIGFNPDYDVTANTRSRTYFDPSSTSSAAGNAIFDNTLADIVRLSAGEAAIAALKFDMVPILQETIDANPFVDAVVLVVRNGINTLQELRRRRIAFAKFDDILAWQMPVTSLYTGGIFRRPRCNETFADVAIEFFDSSCIPHDPTMFQYYDEFYYAKLCEACAMFNGQTCHIKRDHPPRWEMTMELLQSGRVDAAFTSARTLEKWLKNGDFNQDQFQLLCPFTFVHEDGVPRPIPGRPISTSALNNFLNCNFGFLPTDTFMVWRQNPYGHQIAQTMSALYNRFAISDENSVEYPTAAGPESWSSLLRGQYVNNHHFRNSKAEFLYPDGARELTLPPQQDMRNVLGDGFLLYWIEDESTQTVCDQWSSSDRHTTHVGRQVYRLCVPGGQAERQKCDALRLAAQAARVRPLMLCTYAADEKGCVVQVRQQQADLTLVDAVEAYYATRYEQLVLIATESFHETENVVYAVAVSRNAQINSLMETRGAKACFAGYQTAAGWYAPMMEFYRSLLVDQPQTCRMEQAFVDWFGEMCVPGAHNADLRDDGASNVRFDELHTRVDRVGELRRKMCALCRRFGSVVGYNQHMPASATCVSTTDNYYAGSTGALRCLTDNTAEVAFIASSALAAIPVRQRSQYRLLCGQSQGRGSAELSEYATCNIGSVPGRVALINWAASRPQELQIMQRFVQDLTSTFGELGNPSTYRDDKGTFDMFAPRNTTDDAGVYYIVPELRYVEAQSVDRWTAATQPPPMRLHDEVYSLFSEGVRKFTVFDDGARTTSGYSDSFMALGKPLAFSQLVGLLDRRLCQEFLDEDKNDYSSAAASVYDRKSENFLERLAVLFAYFVLITLQPVLCDSMFRASYR